MTTREGPIDWRDKDPITVYIGRSVNVRIPSRNGVEGSTAATFYGATNDISAATLTAKLTINKPDGSTDYTITAPTDSAGSEVDAYTSGFVDSWLYKIPTTATATWSVGTYEGEVVEINTSPTPNEEVPIALLRFRVRKTPSDG